MAIRDRILGLGRQVADGLLDRAQSTLNRAHPPAPQPTPTASAAPEPEATPIFDGAPTEPIPVQSMDSMYAPPSADMSTALTKADMGLPTEPTSEEPKALYWDPFALIEQLGYKEKPSPITYGTLNAMVWKLPLVNAIIQTRLNQMAEFTKACYHAAFGFFNGIETTGRPDNDNRCRCDGNDTTAKLRARALR